MTVALQSRNRFDDSARRWGLCFTAVAVAHALPLLVLSFWLRPAAPPVAAPPPPAVMVDMAPLPAPATPPTPQVAPHVKPQQVEPPRPIEKLAPPKLPVIPTATASLPTEPERQPPAPAKSAPAPTATPAPAPPPTQAAASASVSKVAQTWQGLVLGRLEKFKRYPETAQFHHQEGVVWLRFAMNRDGKVLSASIDKSSGYDLLDAEALALVSRAQPLPKPPADVAGDHLELVAPVEFFMSRRR